MSNEGPQGSKGRLVAKEGSGAITWNTGSSSYEFWEEDIKSVNSIENPDGITGDRSARAERDRAGPYTHGGWIRMPASAGDLVNWLKWATGGSPSGSPTVTYPLATDLTAFGVLVDKVTAFTGLNSSFEVYNAYVDKLVLRGTRRQHDGDGPPQPDFIEMAVNVLGMNQSAGTQTFPTFSLGSTEAYRPYEMSDLTISILGATREIKEWWLMLDNDLFVRRVNSLNPTSIYPRRRQVSLMVRCPNDNDHDDLYDSQLGYSANTATVTLSQGSIATTVFSMVALRAPRNTPHIVGKTEIDTTLHFVAHKLSSTAELVTTNKAS